jgi:hypothetical protein
MLSYLLEFRTGDEAEERCLGNVYTLLIPSVGDTVSFPGFKNKDDASSTLLKNYTVISRHFCYEIDWAQKVVIVVTDGDIADF